MLNAINLLAQTAITENILTIGCTGGGSHKYAKDFDDRLDIKFEQLDELVCLVRGMSFALTNIVGECYTFRHSEDKEGKGDKSSWQQVRSFFWSVLHDTLCLCDKLCVQTVL